MTTEFPGVGQHVFEMVQDAPPVAIPDAEMMMHGCAGLFHALGFGCCALRACDPQEGPQADPGAGHRAIGPARRGTPATPEAPWGCPRKPAPQESARRSRSPRANNSSSVRSTAKAGITTDPPGDRGGDRVREVVRRVGLCTGPHRSTPQRSRCGRRRWRRTQQRMVRATQIAAEHHLRPATVITGEIPGM